jgi:hypothetical protein
MENKCDLLYDPMYHFLIDGLGDVKISGNIHLNVRDYISNFEHF